MKRIRQLLSRLLLLSSYLLFIENIFGQNIVISSIADTIAYVDDTYTYKVSAATTPAKFPVTFSFIKSLSGMIISPTNPDTAVITWTPNSITAGGKVIVKATNNIMESDTQEFYINVSNAIPCPESMVAYWKLDETTGPVYNDFYGDNDAYKTGNAPVGVTGKIDRAQQFDPLNDTKLYVPKKDATFDWGTEVDFSIECWISLNNENIDSVGVIIGKNEGINKVHWWIGIDENEQINFAIQDVSDEVACTGDPISSSWHHVVAVRNAAANSMRLYVDNTLQDTAVYEGWGPGLISDSALCIGWLKPGPGDQGKKYPFNGKIDELIIHNNKALTSQEVSASHSKGNLGKPACRQGNFAPLFRSNPVTEINEDLPYSYQYLAKDIDGDPLLYAITKPAWLSHNAGTRTLSGTPTNDNVGTFAVTIKVNDGSADTVYQNFNITVSNVNDAPELANVEASALAFTEGDSTSIITSSITVNDVDDTSIESASVSFEANYSTGEDILTFINTAKITGSWNATTGVLTLSGSDLEANYQTALQSVKYKNTSEDPSSLIRTVGFKIYDGEEYSNLISRNISVIPVNDPPVISGHQPVNTPEDDTILIRLEHLLFTDVDDSTEELSLTVKDGVHYTHAGNIVTPDANYNDTVHVNIQLSDQTAAMDYILPVYVIPVNDLPYYTFNTPPTAYEGQFYFLAISASDVDSGDILTFSAPQLPSWLQLNGNLLTGKPGFINAGENTVKIRVTDGKVNVDTAFIITVFITNHKPYISSAPVTTVNEDEDYVYNIQCADADTTDILILSADSIPDWLTFDSNLKKLSGKPTNDQVGYHSDSTYLVKLRISDLKQDSLQTYTITVKNVNDAPVISGQVSIPVVNPDSSLLISLDDLILQDVDNPNSELYITIFSGSGYSIIGNIITIISSIPGQLSVKIVVDDGISESNEYGFKVEVKTLTGLHESNIQNNSAVKVYPNPADVLVHFDFDLNDDGWIEVFSIDGTIILKQLIDKNMGSYELNTIDLAAGIYHYKIYNRTDLYIGKFIVE